MLAKKNIFFNCHNSSLLKEGLKGTHGIYNGKTAIFPLKKK